mmetsp:Transcript_5365/g.16919  ORF Transcript_5365/g.16919 Transcript_5365/m.16919 type:complete len:563 (+) Transcript_5365:1598-3286(+)
MPVERRRPGLARNPSLESGALSGNSGELNSGDLDCSGQSPRSGQSTPAASPRSAASPRPGISKNPSLESGTLLDDDAKKKRPRASGLKRLAAIVLLTFGLAYYQPWTRLGAIAAAWTRLGSPTAASYSVKEDATLAEVAKREGFAIREGAVAPEAAEKVAKALHTRLAIGECITFGYPLRSGWMRKSCPLPLDFNDDASAVLRDVSMVMKSAIEAAAGPDPQVCEYGSMFSFPGATAQNAHKDVTSNGAATLVVYLNGVVEDAAPLQVWPKSHGRAEAAGPGVRLAPLAPGTAVIYDATLQHRGTENTSPNVRTSLFVTYCQSIQEAGGPTVLPELHRHRFKLSEVIDGSAFSIVKRLHRHPESKYDKLCASCLGGYTGEVSYGPLKDYETSENGDPHDSGGKVCPEHVYEDTSTRHPPCAWPAMNCTHGDGCRPDVYARATANVFKHFVWSRRFVAAPRVWAKDNTYAQATANVFKHLARSERYRSEFPSAHYDDCSFCDSNLIQRLSQVGVFRRDSVLWPLAQHGVSKNAASPERRELLDQASAVMKAAMESVRMDIAGL